MNLTIAILLLVAAVAVVWFGFRADRRALKQLTREPDVTAPMLCHISEETNRWNKLALGITDDDLPGAGHSSGSTEGPEFDKWWAEFGPNIKALSPQMIALCGWSAARRRIEDWRQVRHQ